MALIEIHFEVENPLEIVKLKKGKLTGNIANLFMTKEKMKFKVEEAICKEITDALKVNISQKLKEEGVKFKMKIKYTI